MTLCLTSLFITTNQYLSHLKRKVYSLRVTLFWLNIHNFQMRYLCTSCQYQTVNKQCYLEHLEIKHDSKNLKIESSSKIPKHVCLQCDYQTDKKQLLKMHQLVHLDIKLWQCSQCNYKTSRECNLTCHTKSIHENFRYQCDICPYTTTRTSYLKDHLRFLHKEPINRTKTDEQ